MKYKNFCKDDLMNAAADRLEELDERAAIMEEGRECQTTPGEK